MPVLNLPSHTHIPGEGGAELTAKNFRDIIQLFSAMPLLSSVKVRYLASGVATDTIDVLWDGSRDDTLLRRAGAPPSAVILVRAQDVGDPSGNASGVVSTVNFEFRTDFGRPHVCKIYEPVGLTAGSEYDLTFLFVVS